MKTKLEKVHLGVSKYLNDEENIKHISLIVYDILPLGVKLGLRYEKFHDKFNKNFSAVRDNLLGKLDKSIVDEINNKKENK